MNQESELRKPKACKENWIIVTEICILYSKLYFVQILNNRNVSCAATIDELQKLNRFVTWLRKSIMASKKLYYICLLIFDHDRKIREVIQHGNCSALCKLILAYVARVKYSIIIDEVFVWWWLSHEVLWETCGLVIVEYDRLGRSYENVTDQRDGGRNYLVKMNASLNQQLKKQRRIYFIKETLTFKWTIISDVKFFFVNYFRNVCLKDI